MLALSGVEERQVECAEKSHLLDFSAKFVPRPRHRNSPQVEAEERLVFMLRYKNKQKNKERKNTHKITETIKHTAEMTVQTQTSCTFKYNSCLLSHTVPTQRRGRGLHSREDHSSEEDDAMVSHSAHRKDAWLQWSEWSCAVSLRVSMESSHFLNKPPDSLKRRLSVHNDCLIAVPPLAGPQPLQN